MIESKSRSPVRSFQDGLKSTGKVHKHVADQEEPGECQRGGQNVVNSVSRSVHVHLHKVPLPVCTIQFSL